MKPVAQRSDDKSGASDRAMALSHGNAIPRRERLTDRVYGRILELIASGQVLEGARLPSENQLCDRFAVSRPVVRDALARLRNDGIVLVRQGVGSFVRRAPPRELLAGTGAADVAGLMRCMEVRLALEPAAAHHAALRASPTDLTRIATALDVMDRSMRARAPLREADFDFHMAIASASGNDLFSDMLHVARPVMLRGIGVAQDLTRSGSTLRIDTVIEEHQQVVEAIRARDSEGAALLMRYHLVQARRRVTDQRQLP